MITCQICEKEEAVDTFTYPKEKVIVWACQTCLDKLRTKGKIKEEERLEGHKSLYYNE